MIIISHMRRAIALWYFIKYQKNPAQSEKEKDWLLCFFQKEKGLILKLGQIWGTSTQLRELLFQSNFTLSQDEQEKAQERIAFDLKRPFSDVFTPLELLSDRASLSIVYLSTLKNSSQKVAIKVKRAGIEELLKEQFAFLKALTYLQKFSPLKKHQFDFEAYLAECELMVEKELDYISEAKHQISFAKSNAHRQAVKVPMIHDNLIFDDWFVQEYVAGEDYIKLLQQWPHQQRETLLYLFCETFLEQLFIDGNIQGDSHLGNYLFRNDPTFFEQIIFLDFGSHLNLTEMERKALLCLFDSVHQGQLSEKNVHSLLVHLGFDEQKLTSLGPVLLSVVQQMLSVLALDKACSLGTTPKMSLEQMLREKKWILRSSGPPRFLQIMRAFYGLIQLLKKSQVSLNFYQLYHRFRAQHSDLLLHIQLQELKMTHTEISMQAKNLKIIVKTNGSTTVDLTLPVTSIYELEDLLPASAGKALEKLQIDLEQIKTQAVHNGLRPGILFEWTNEEKAYQISLI